MDPSTRAKIINAFTAYDRRASSRKDHNPYALGHYCKALHRVDRYLEAGYPLRSAIVSCFCGRLCDSILRAIGEPLMTKEEARYGLLPALPYLDDEDDE